MAKAKAAKTIGVLSSGVNVDPLPGCCGIKVISELSTEKFTIVSAKEYQKGVEEWLYDTPEDSGITTATRAKTLTDNFFDEEIGRCGVIATTIPSQKKAIAALKDEGFVALKSFRNPRTRNTVTIWFMAPRK